MLMDPMEPLASPPPETPRYTAAREIVANLRDHGHLAYFAGGCVRDHLLGTPAKDFDVATSATPEAVLQIFSARGLRTLSVGAHFGVVLVCLGADEAGREIQTEVATFRHDGAYADGRRPNAVQYTTDPREDVLRRDFTINGMLLDPLASSGDPLAPSDPLAPPGTPALLDFVGGQSDLTRRIIRAIGNPLTRFTEDKLRMLRAVRFAARLHFTLDPSTAAAITHLAPEILQVSAERIREELTKILTEGGARRCFELLLDLGLLPHLLPEAVRTIGVEQPPDWHPEGDVWTHTMLLLEKLPPACSPTLAWGALLHDIGKPPTYHHDSSDPTHPRIRFNGHVEVGVRIAETILRRLRFSNEDTDQILALIKNHMRFGDFPSMRESTVKRFLRLPRFQEHLDLHWLDCTSCHGRLGIWEAATARFHAEPTPETRPHLLLTGRDLIAAGYPPGPRFKEILTAAEDAQLEGAVLTPADALAYVHARFGPPEPHKALRTAPSLGAASR